MVITYGAQVSATYHRYQSTQSNPELCFILVPNSRELEGYSLEKISKPVNHPTLDRAEQSDAVGEIPNSGHLQFQRIVFELGLGLVLK